MNRDGDVQCESHRRSYRQRFVAAEAGSALIELGLLLPVVLAIILAVSEVGVYLQRSMIVIEAASVGARFGVVPANVTNVTGMVQAAQNAAGGLSGFAANATTFCSCSPGGTQVSCSSTCGSLVALSHYVQVTTSATVPGLFNISVLQTSIHPVAVSTMRASWPGQ